MTATTRPRPQTRRLWRVWVCDGHGKHCGWIYTSPIPVAEVTHRCPARTGTVTRLRGVE